MDALFGDFSSRGEVEDRFEDLGCLDGADVVVGTYDWGNWEGYAWLCFRRAGRWYVVSAGHCSCNGLEGMWSPEETTLALIRAELGRDGGDAQMLAALEGVHDPTLDAASTAP